MKQADLTDLRDRIADLAKDSVVGERVEGVSVEVGEYTEGGDFLRVVVQLRNPEEVDVKALEPLVHSIEDLVSQLDERFPSVRFGEAA